MTKGLPFFSIAANADSNSIAGLSCSNCLYNFPADAVSVIAATVLKYSSLGSVISPIASLSLSDPSRYLLFSLNIPSAILNKLVSPVLFLSRPADLPALPFANFSASFDNPLIPGPRFLLTILSANSLNLAPPSSIAIKDLNLSGSTVLTKFSTSSTASLYSVDPLPGALKVSGRR